MPTAEQQWSDFQRRVVEGQLTEPEKRLIRRSMEHSMKADRLESRTRSLESQLTKVGEQLADAAISDGALELEGKDEFLRRFEADPVSVVTELHAEAPMVVDQRFFGEALPSRGDLEKADVARRLGLGNREVL